MNLSAAKSPLEQGGRAEYQYERLSSQTGLIGCFCAVSYQTSAYARLNCRTLEDENQPLSSETSSLSLCIYG